MKTGLLLVSLLIFCTGSAQQQLPVVHARSSKARIYEQDNSVSNWNITPGIRPDIFTTSKLVSAKTIRFKTDIDSIEVTIKPGGKEEFIVLLNGKDSCLTSIQSPPVMNFSKLKPAIHDTIPFFVNRYNTNLLQLVFNATDSVILNFDTGATEVSFTTEAIKKKIRSKLQLYNRNYDFRIGSHQYQSKVYDTELVGNETDGLLGWNLFDGMIVELNYDSNQLCIHSKMPEKLKRDKEYARFRIKYINNRPFIVSEVAAGKQRNEDWFLFDLGYQRTVMLDNDLLKEAGFSTDSMEVIKKVIMHGTRGNEVPVTTLNLETLKIGKFRLKNVPVQLLEGSKPMRGVNIHLLGNEVLKRFNTVLDFQRNSIYLKPNRLYNTGYADQKKST